MRAVPDVCMRGREARYLSCNQLTRQEVACSVHDLWLTTNGGLSAEVAAIIFAVVACQSETRHVDCTTSRLNPTQRWRTWLSNGTSSRTTSMNGAGNALTIQRNPRRHSRAQPSACSTPCALQSSGAGMQRRHRRKIYCISELQRRFLLRYTHCRPREAHIVAFAIPSPIQIQKTRKNVAAGTCASRTN
jgi:hypothetical protein